MNSLEFLNNKKVWRPHFSSSPPIIDVVTQCRQKAHPKEEYSLKVSNIEMQDEPNFAYAENFSKISTTCEKTNVHFIEWTKQQRSHENGKNKNEDYVNISTYSQHVKNEITFKQNFPKQVITVKKEKKIARKVYLKWSKYSSTNQTDKNDIKLDLCELNRKHFLQKKYWDLWRKQLLLRRKSSSLKVHTSVKMNPKPKKIMNRGNSEDNLICSSKPQKPVISKRNSEHDILKQNKTSKSIVEMQKQKIQEQENIIKELQLARIKLETEKVNYERQSLLNDTYEKADQKLKSKAKFLSMCNLPTKIDSSKYKNSWEFVTKMELRAEERKKRWEIIKERKQKLEEERLEKLKIEEERRKRIEEEEKKRKILQLKLEKQRQEEMRKKQEEERLYFHALNLKAKEHYNSRLCQATLDAFKHILETKNFMMKEAERYHKEKILLYYFTIWKLFYRIRVQRKEDKAQMCLENRLLRKGFECLKLTRKQYISNLQVAIDFNDFNIQKDYFYQWRVFVHKQKHETLKKEEWATNFYHEKLLQRCLQCWLKLPQIIFQERNKEQRIRQWYNKVQEILPDFQSSSECL
ncbi:calponin homology domain-containing protein DDB_G0272472-like [Planococcus citri]|uniref:calponin homology domain-containing protein DDB_G0272472-like n=1 Tax=Planococcus citri TaxID=170843 RepID=UPI0031F74718